MDTKLLLFLNFDGGQILDKTMWFFTSAPSFILIGITLLYLLYRAMPINDFVLSLLFAGLVVLMADQTATFFKHNVEFLRPTHTPELDGLLHTVNGYVGGLYGTVSGHAANSFGLALYGSLILRKRWVTILLFSFAVLTSYSRMYLGVHFPLQILYGIILGLTTGAVSYLIFSYARKNIRNDHARKI
ncbi:MAG: phosphatase PAP2 family protein [Rikenellaceae bacterium]